MLSACRPARWGAHVQSFACAFTIWSVGMQTSTGQHGHRPVAEVVLSVTARSQAGIANTHGLAQAKGVQAERHSMRAAHIDARGLAQHSSAAFPPSTGVSSTQATAARASSTSSTRPCEQQHPPVCTAAPSPLCTALHSPFSAAPTHVTNSNHPCAQPPTHL